MPAVGAHVSGLGGLWRSIEKGEEIGAEVIQIFGASPRAWQVRVPQEAEAEKFLEVLRKSKIQSVYLHAPYLINIASPEERIRKLSVEALAAHLRIAEALWAEGLVFHLGSGKELPREQVIDRIAFGMNEALEQAPGEAKLIMENSAGGGHRVGSTAKDLGELLEKLGSERVQICFDTAHAFEAGVIEAYTSKNIKALLREWDEKVGFRNVAVIHANDSKTPYNSHNDRHENIGEGFIGIEGFRNLAKENKLRDKPWILEVPGFDGEGPDRKNVELLKSCFSG